MCHALIKRKVSHCLVISKIYILHMESGIALAVCAGLFAALASVSSKLALEQGGKTINYFLPCEWLSELQCKNV